MKKPAIESGVPKNKIMHAIRGQNYKHPTTPIQRRR
jgi:hypothetical protein